MSEAFITRRGGADLNFGIVGGTTQPENPKENTIWVNTDQEITGWSFNTNAPENPVEGMVWFLLSTNSNGGFDVLSDNELIVNPMSAWQYVSGSWTKKDAYTYSNGAWNEWIVYLYDKGNEFSNVTGGWAAQSYNSATSFFKSYSGFSKGETSVCVNIPGNQGNTITSGGPKNMIDLTPYSVLEVDVSSVSAGGTSSVGVAILDTMTSYVSETKITSTGTIRCNIASITGEKYIVIYAKSQNGSSTLYVTGMRLLP